MDKNKILELQDKIGYQFQSIRLLRNALTHSSYANEQHWRYSRNNERLEFLGDAVLELVSSEYIFTEYPDMEEGRLTKLRAGLVCEMSLASSAREIGLGEYLYLGRGELRTGGNERDSTLSDAFEAIIGAIYLDGGLDAAKAFIQTYVLSDIRNKQLFYDSKTILQELVQSKMHADTHITYQLSGETGPDHNKTFEVTCYINDIPYGRGRGKAKKRAEQQAAYKTILLLRY